MGCFGACFTHAQTCETFLFKVLRNGLLRHMLYTCPNLRNVPVQSATQWTASAHALHMPKPVITFLFKVLRNGLLRHMLYTCPNLRNVPVQSATQWTASAHALHMPKPAKRSCSKCYAMDCFGTCFTHAQTCETFLFKVLRNGLLRHMLYTHAQTCDNVPVQSATQWTASAHALHMPKPAKRSCSKCYAMDCFGTCFTHAQTCETFLFKVLRNGLLRHMLYTCPNLRNVPVQSATQWTASAHALHMPKPAKRSCSKCYAMDCFGTCFIQCYAMDCFGTCFTHAQTCDNVPVQSATQWTASAHALHMPKPVITFLFKVLRNGLLRHMLYTCPNLRNVPVQSATQWTASAHALHMPKPVITFLFKVLRNGLLRHMLYTCPNL